jgi:hypothetical protein
VRACDGLNCYFHVACALVCRLGFIQTPTFEKTGFQIPLFPKKKKPVITGFRIFTKNIIKKLKNIYAYFKICI